MSSADQANWEGFFARAEKIKVPYRMTGLTGSGTSAEAQVVATYNYMSGGNAQPKLSFEWKARFTHDGSGWRLDSLR